MSAAMDTIDRMVNDTLLAVSGVPMNPSYINTGINLRLETLREVKAEIMKAELREREDSIRS